MGVPAEMPTVHLPPRDAWLVNPALETFSTPVDDRGLVIVNDLISLVKSTIDPSYKWPKDDKNEHHFYWEESRFPRDFRELPVNKGYMPYVFHNWIHRITFQPPDLEQGIMEQRIEAWEIARSLFRKARIQTEKKLRIPHKKLRLERKDGNGDLEIIDNEYMAEILLNILADNDNKVARVINYVPELGIQETLSREPRKIVRTMGKIMVRRNMQLVPSIAA